MMTTDKEIARYLPLTEATFCILLALTEPLHGYGIMQQVESASAGSIQIGPGTLYGALTHLEKEKLVALLDEVERRKRYVLTEKGRRVLDAELTRLHLLIRLGSAFMGRRSPVTQRENSGEKKI
jgi:DNA-binding PadR family transcriptional regulator